MPGFWDQLKMTAEAQNQREAQINERQMGLLSSVLSQQQQQQNAYSNMASLGMGAIRDKASIINQGIDRAFTQDENAVQRAFQMDQDTKRFNQENTLTDKKINADISLTNLQIGANKELEKIRGEANIALEKLKNIHDLAIVSANTQAEKDLIDHQYQLEKKALSDKAAKQEALVQKEINNAKREQNNGFKIFSNEIWNIRGGQNAQ